MAKAKAKSAPKSQTPVDPYAQPVSRRIVAQFFGVTLGGVDYWAANGCPRTTKGFILPDVAKWVTEQRKMREAPTPSDDALLSAGVDSPALERYREARADLAEIELRKKRGELCDISVAIEVQTWVTRRVAEILSRLVPVHRVAEHNALADDWNECIEAIEKQMLRQFSVAQLQSAGLPYTEDDAAAARSESDESE